MEPSHSLIDPALAHQGVLSQFSREHPEHLAAADPPAFNQAGEHPHILDQLRVPPGAAALLGWPGSGRVGRGLGWAILARPALIEVALLAFALGFAVISGAALRRSLLAVGLPAAKRTAQVLPIGIARMGQEENATVPAPGQAGAQMRLGPQYRSQQHVILQYQGGYRASAVPVRPELKTLCDPNCKRPKLSLRMLMLKAMSPSYPIGTPVSIK
jgi:hypothetical protein